MLSRNRRFQRITVGVVIGVVVFSLALSLLSVAFAATLGADLAPGLDRSGPGPVPLAGDAPTPVDAGLAESTSDPLPVTRTPQGTSTQVTDEEHLGGLIGFVVLMLGGALLLVRAKRRERREMRATEGAEAILSRP